MSFFVYLFLNVFSPSALVTRVGQKIHLQWVCIFFTPNRTVHMQLYCCSTPLPRSLRHTWGISRRNTLSLSWSSCTINHSITKDTASRSFYGYWQRFCFRAGNMIITGRLIVAICGMFQGLFSYGIIRHVNLFSDQLLCVASLWSFTFLFVWDYLKLKRLIVTSDAVSDYECCYVGSSSGLIQHVCQFFLPLRDIWS
jgi:hypothetical protein